MTGWAGQRRRAKDHFNLVVAISLLAVVFVLADDKRGSNYNPAKGGALSEKTEVSKKSKSRQAEAKSYKALLAEAKTPKRPQDDGSPSVEQVAPQDVRLEIAGDMKTNEKVGRAGKTNELIGDIVKKDGLPRLSAPKSTETTSKAGKEKDPPKPKKKKGYQLLLQNQRKMVQKHRDAIEGSDTKKRDLSKRPVPSFLRKMAKKELAQNEATFLMIVTPSTDLDKIFSVISSIVENLVVENRVYPFTIFFHHSPPGLDDGYRLDPQVLQMRLRDIHHEITFDMYELRSTDIDDFSFLSLYNRGELKKYRYAWRIDPDVVITCPVKRDIMKWMDDAQMVYAWKIHMQENGFSSENIWTEFADQNFGSVGNLRFGLLSRHDCHYWDIVEIWNLEWFRTMSRETKGMIYSVQDIINNDSNVMPIHKPMILRSFVTTHMIKMVEIHEMTDVGLNYKRVCEFHCLNQYGDVGIKAKAMAQRCEATLAKSMLSAECFDPGIRDVLTSVSSDFLVECLYVFFAIVSIILVFQLQRKTEQVSQSIDAKLK